MADKRYPPSSYDARYPFNRKTTTESGIELEFDDTPGKERVRLAHPSGSHIEYSANGRVVEVTVAGRSEYVKGGVTSTIDDNVDSKVGGSSRTSVTGDTHSEVNGHSTSMIQGDQKSIVGGDSVSAVRGDSVHGVVGKAVYKFGGGLQMKFDGKTSDKTKVESKIDVPTTIELGSTLFVEALDEIKIESSKKIVLKVGSTKLTLLPDKAVLVSDSVYVDAKDEDVKITASNKVKVMTDGGTKIEDTEFGPVGRENPPDV